AHLLETRGVASVGAIRSGIERLRSRLGDFLCESILKTGRVLRRHGVSSQAIPVAPRSQLHICFRLPILRNEKLRAPAHVRESLGEKGEVRGEVPARHPKARNLDIPPG